MNYYGKARTILYDLRKNNLPFISNSFTCTPHSHPQEHKHNLYNAYIHNNPCTKAQNLIQSHLNKLTLKKHLLQQHIRNSSFSSSNSIYAPHSICIPVNSPQYQNNKSFSYKNIQLGTPFSPHCCCNHSHIPELLSLFAIDKIASYKQHHIPIIQIPHIIHIDKPYHRYRTPSIRKQCSISPRKANKTPPVHVSTSSHGSSIRSCSDAQPVMVVREVEEREEKVERKWWKLACDFVYVFMFFSFAMKYARYAKIRSGVLAKRNKDIGNDIAKIKEWVINIEKPFWDEFKIFDNLDVSFRNVDSVLKIEERSQMIIAIIKKYIENLIRKSSKLKDIPYEIQKTLYSYIKNKSFFPKKYLSTFQVNRLEFNVYGESYKITEPQAGMILAFLIISGVTVQHILLHMKTIFPTFRYFPNIVLTARYIGSIMHYLTRDTYHQEPEIVNDLLVLLNYYRNYHIYNEQVEKQIHSYIHNNNTSIAVSDIDELEMHLVPQDTISKFWELNQHFVRTYKNYIYAWSIKLANSITRKFKTTNISTKPKARRPKNKKVEYYSH